MPASLDIRNRLTQALQSAVLSGGPTLAELRRHFQGLVPEDSLQPLIVNVVDPELLQEVLGPAEAAPWVRLLWAQYDRVRLAFPADWADVELAWRQQRLQWRVKAPRPLARPLPEHDPSRDVPPAGVAALPRVRPVRRSRSDSAGPSATSRSLDLASSSVAPPPLEELPPELDLEPVSDEEPDAVSGRSADRPVFRPEPESLSGDAPASRAPQSEPAVLPPDPALRAPASSQYGVFLSRLLAALLSGDGEQVALARELWVRGGPDGVLYDWVACAIPPSVSDRLRRVPPERAISAGR